MVAQRSASSESPVAAITVSVPPSSVARAAPNTRRWALARQRGERVDDDRRVAAALDRALGALDRELGGLGLGVGGALEAAADDIDATRAPLADLLGAHAGEHDLDVDVARAARARPRARAAACVAPAPGGPATATREPRPNGSLRSDAGPSIRADGKTAVRSLNQGRSSGGSASAPLTVATRISEGWRSLRRGGRSGPLTTSPALSSQRRIWAGET